MDSNKTWKQIASVFLLLLGGGISLWWAVSLERGTQTGIMGFPGIYLGTQCLLHGCDPYNVQQLQQTYTAAGLAPASGSTALRQSVTLYVNLPSTFLFVAPFATLPLSKAQLLWSSLVVGSFFLASIATWYLAKRYAADVALLLIFLLLANCEILFAGGNTAGLVVGLSVLSAYCFLEERFIAFAVVGLAVSLAIKPHDAGLIWFYFLIAGQTHRRRALLSAALAVGLACITIVWVSYAAPHWFPEFRANLAAISAPGGINEPSPTSIGVNSPDMIVDLQTVTSVFAADSRIYNLAAYALCGTLFVLWVVAVRRMRQTLPNALFALVSVASLSMLVTYHRSYDARLLLFSIPACAILWAEREPIRWSALVLSTAGILMTGDVPLTAVVYSTRNLRSYTDGLAGRLQFVLLARPAPLLLLAISVFYLWVIFRRARNSSAGIRTAEGTISSLASSKVS